MLPFEDKALSFVCPLKAISTSRGHGLSSVPVVPFLLVQIKSMISRDVKLGKGETHWLGAASTGGTLDVTGIFISFHLPSALKCIEAVRLSCLFTCIDKTLVLSQYLFYLSLCMPKYMSDWLLQLYPAIKVWSLLPASNYKLVWSFCHLVHFWVHSNLTIIWLWKKLIKIVSIFRNLVVERNVYIFNAKLKDTEGELDRFGNSCFNNIDSVWWPHGPSSWDWISWLNDYVHASVPSHFCINLCPVYVSSFMRDLFHHSYFVTYAKPKKMFCSVVGRYKICMKYCMVLFLFFKYKWKDERMESNSNYKNNVQSYKFIRINEIKHHLCPDLWI